MATPTLESFCCLDHHSGNYSASSPRSNVFNSQTLDAYNFICIACGSLGILGSIFQLFPRKPTTIIPTRRAFFLYTRQNVIICFLALADLLASLGIVIRSSVWLSGFVPGTKMSHLYSNTTVVSELNLFYTSCAMLSGWIQYFYICTYAWTMVYAIDIYRLLQDKNSPLSLYHVSCWGLSFLFTAGGLLSLYFPTPLQCVYDVMHTLPHFLTAYLTIIVVMVTNPILYWRSAKKVQDSIILQRGQYTDQERLVVKSVRRKFHLVIVVFFVCWSPNILNGILLLFRREIDHDVFIILWMAMAVLNPLQGFLNCLVYKGAGGFNLHLREATRSSPAHYGSFLTRSVDSDEDAPLLSYRGVH